MAVEMVIGIAALALLGGAAIGYLLGKGRNNSARVQELEEALASSQSELADYRSEVYGQFAETAEKFRALDKSYNDLHRQLAESSVALCGDEATPLLAGPGQSLLTDADEAAREEKEINPAAEGTDAPATDTSTEPPLAEGDTSPVAGTEPGGEDISGQNSGEDRAESGTEDSRGEHEAPEDELVGTEKDPAAFAEDDNIVVGESTDVPVLTDVQEGDADAAQAIPAAEESLNDSRKAGAS